MSKTRRFSNPTFRNQERQKNGGLGESLRNKEREAEAAEAIRYAEKSSETAG